MPNEPDADTAPSPTTEPTRPAPPPFRPDNDLIGYVEKGQRPASPPSETGS